jgi:hypothetical protein
MLLLLATILFNNPLGVPDTLYTQGQKIVCHVKEVTEHHIRYIHPNEEALYTLATFKVQKIAFSSGRSQTFVSPPPSNQYWKNVKLAHYPAEIEGMHSLGPIAITSKGNTPFSGTLPVRNRAEGKLKHWGALIGADVLLLTDRTIQARGIFRRAHITMGCLAYTYHIITLDEAKAAIGTTKKFGEFFTSKFSNKRITPSWPVRTGLTFRFDTLYTNQGMTYADCKAGLDSWKKLRIVDIQKDRITLLRDTKKTLYTFVVKTDTSSRKP